MFEGKPPFAPEASNSDADASAGERLRRLSWGDLVAKLEAARDLSEFIAHEKNAGGAFPAASFDAHSAHHLAEQQEHFHANDKLPVNPLNLGNLKEGRGKEAPSNSVQDGASRGRT